MNSNFSQFIQSSSSGWGCLLSLILLALGLSALGLGWLVNGVVILIAIVTLLPVVGILVAAWWLKRNVATGACPACGGDLTALNNSTVNCAHCGIPLEVRSRQFQRVTQPGTVDVEAVTVEVMDTNVLDGNVIDAEIVDESDR